MIKMKKYPRCLTRVFFVTAAQAVTSLGFTIPREGSPLPVGERGGSLKDFLPWGHRLRLSGSRVNGKSTALVTRAGRTAGRVGWKILSCWGVELLRDVVAEGVIVNNIMKLMMVDADSDRGVMG